MVSATNRPLNELILSNDFREDLYFRLRFFPVALPPLRERDDDALVLVEYFLLRLAEKYETVKRLSKQARKFLTSHDWPGNVREARRVAAMGFCMAEGNVIEIDDFADSLESRKEGEAEAEEIAPIHVRLFDSMVKDKKSFWEAMHEPFMQREYGREEIRNVIRKGLIQTRGSYRDLVELFNVEDDDYQKFMDFLRHQKLKPESVFSEKV